LLKILEWAHWNHFLPGVSLAVALAAAGCASGETVELGGGTPDGGSGGEAGGGVTGGGGEGGTTGPCAVDCEAIQTPQCQVGQCNTQTGQCEVVADEDGTACDDGQFCTVDDACAAGQC